MYDPSPEAAALRRQAAADAAHALHRLARIAFEHSNGPAAAAEFTRRLATRASRLTWDVNFLPEGVVLLGTEHEPHGSTAVVCTTLATPVWMDDELPGAGPVATPGSGGKH